MISFGLVFTMKRSEESVFAGGLSLLRVERVSAANYMCEGGVLQATER